MAAPLWYACRAMVMERRLNSCKHPDKSHPSRQTPQPMLALLKPRLVKAVAEAFGYTQEELRFRSSTSVNTSIPFRSPRRGCGRSRIRWRLDVFSYPPSLANRYGHSTLAVDQILWQHRSRVTRMSLHMRAKSVGLWDGNNTGTTWGGKHPK